MRLAQSSVVYGNVDRSWLGSTEIESSMGVTLDMALFPPGIGADKFGSGGPNTAEVRILAGTAIGIVTATGYAGPYTTAAANGLEVCAGLLLNDEEGVGVAPYQYVTTAVVRDGIVYTDRLPLPTGVGLGKLDAAAQVDLKLIDFRVRGVL